MKEYIINQSNHSQSAPVLPRPLTDAVIMKGYTLETYQPQPSSRDFRYNGSFDGKKVWLGLAGDPVPLTSINVVNDQMDNFKVKTYVDMQAGETEGVFYLQPMVYDGRYKWLLPQSLPELIRLDPLTGNHISYPLTELENPLNCTGGIFDGTYIWMRFKQQNLVRFDPKMFSFVEYSLPDIITHTFLYDGCKNLLIGGRKELIIMNLKTMEMQTHIWQGEQGSGPFYAGAFDGTCYWFIPFSSNYVVSFNLVTEEFVQYPMQDGVNGNTNLGNCQNTEFSNKFLSATWDGKYVWMAPSRADRLVRLDPQTGTMKGYEITGLNLEDWQEPMSGSGASCHDIVYDGKNLWLVPFHRKNLVKVSPAEDNTLALTEEYVDQNGSPIKPSNIRWLDPGDNYSETAPVIQGYTRTGHKIDGGALNASITASIPDVQSDHVVTFVYESGEEELDTFTITQLYRLDDGTALLPTDFATVGEGSTYSKAAPTISGYRYMGYQVDSGAVESGITASIYNVASDHTVTFLYEPDSDGDTYTITESYMNLMDGSTTQPDTFTQIPAGGSYNKAAPVINGYRRAGHRIDGGTNSTDLTAQISLVNGNHQVTYLYIPGDEEGGIEGGSCCCCGEMELRLKLPVGNNKEVLEELKELVQTVKGCANSDCC